MEKSHVLGTFCKTLLENKLRLIITILVGIGSLISSIAYPLLFRYLIDDVISKFSYDRIWSSLIIIVSTIFIAIIAQFLYQYLSENIFQTFTVNLSNEIFYHVLNLPMESLNKKDNGDILSKITNDVAEVQNFFSQSFFVFFFSTIKLLITGIILYKLCPTLFICSVVVIPFYLVSFKAFGGNIRTTNKVIRSTVGEMLAYIEESLDGMLEIKMFNYLNKRKDTFDERMNELKKMKMKLYQLKALNVIFSKGISMLGPVIVLCLGSVIAIKGNITIGTLIAYMVYIDEFYDPIHSFVTIKVSFDAAIMCIKRIDEFLDEKVEETEEGELLNSNNEIVINNLSYKYNEVDSNVIKFRNYKFQRGKNYIILGKNGRGKTTLINILSGTYSHYYGSVTIDDNALVNINKKNLRQHISIVPQNIFLFKGTILENIRLGKMSAEDSEIIEVCKNIGAHSIIESLENGYDTMLNSGGTNLSNGQKQVIGIARAILKNANIIMLDEPTSSLDKLTKHVIKGILEMCKEKKIIIAISHDKDIIDYFDEVVEL